MVKMRAFSSLLLTFPLFQNLLHLHTLNLATIMSDQGFWYFVLNPFLSNQIIVKKYSLTAI